MAVALCPVYNKSLFFSGKALVLQSQRTEFPYVPVVMTCFVIIIILCVPCCKKKTSAAEGPGEKRGQFLEMGKLLSGQ